MPRAPDERLGRRIDGGLVVLAVVVPTGLVWLHHPWSGSNVVWRMAVSLAVGVGLGAAVARLDARPAARSAVLALALAAAVALLFAAPLAYIAEHIAEVVAGEVVRAMFRFASAAAGPCIGLLLIARRAASFRVVLGAIGAALFLNRFDAEVALAAALVAGLAVAARPGPGALAGALRQRPVEVACGVVIAVMSASLAWDLAATEAQLEGAGRDLMDHWGRDSVLGRSARAALGIALIGGALALARGRTSGLVSVLVLAPALLLAALLDRPPGWSAGCIGWAHPLTFGIESGLLPAAMAVMTVPWLLPLGRAVRAALYPPSARPQA